jgi:hypothetical protein
MEETVRELQVQINENKNLKAQNDKQLLDIKRHQLKLNTVIIFILINYLKIKSNLKYSFKSNFVKQKR